MRSASAGVQVTKGGGSRGAHSEEEEEEEEEADEEEKGAAHKGHGHSALARVLMGEEAGCGGMEGRTQGMRID